MSRHEEAKLSRVGQTLFGFHPPSYSLLRLSAVTMQLMGGIDPLYNGSGRPFMKTEESGLQCGFTQDDICKGLDSLVFIEPLPQTEPVDCEACFLETLHMSGQ